MEWKSAPKQLLKIITSKNHFIDGLYFTIKLQLVQFLFFWTFELDKPNRCGVKPADPKNKRPTLVLLTS